MSTKVSHKEECNEVLTDITKTYGDNKWFISGFIDSDDHGPHVVIKVKRDDKNRVKIVHPNNSVKVCVYLMKE